MIITSLANAQGRVDNGAEPALLWCSHRLPIPHVVSLNKSRRAAPGRRPACEAATCNYQPQPMSCCSFCSFYCLRSAQAVRYSRRPAAWSSPSLYLAARCCCMPSEDRSGGRLGQPLPERERWECFAVVADRERERCWNERSAWSLDKVVKIVILNRIRATLGRTCALARPA